jgi:serine/threonine-protein kinase
MPPEVILGAGTIDRRADLYGLGCVAFWLLTGELLFHAKGPAEMLKAHASAPPDAPSARTELVIPEGLDALIVSCLAKDPADRPESAAALATALQALGIEGAWTAGRRHAWWQLHVPRSATA